MYDVWMWIRRAPGDTYTTLLCASLAECNAKKCHSRELIVLEYTEAHTIKQASNDWWREKEREQSIALPRSHADSYIFQAGYWGCLSSFAALSQFVFYSKCSYIAGEFNLIFSKTLQMCTQNDEQHDQH